MNRKKLITIISIVFILTVMLCVSAFAAYTIEDGNNYYLSTYNSLFLPYTEENIEKYPVERRFTGYSVLLFDDNYNYPVYDLLGDETSWYYVSDLIPTDLFTMAKVSNSIYLTLPVAVIDGFIFVTASGNLENMDDLLIFSAPYSDGGLPAGIYIRSEAIDYFDFIAVQPPVISEISLFDTLEIFVDSSVSWISSFVSAITNNAILLCFVIIAFCGLGIGLFSRLKR